MSDPRSQEITHLLQAWGQDDAAALERLMPLVYAELRRLRHRPERAATLHRHRID